MPQSTDNKIATFLSSAEHLSALAFALRLADAAAKITLPNFRASLTADNKAKAGEFDPVTQADRDAEQAMRALIQKERPEDGILGEEFESIPAQNGLTWVLDPIDGTRSFIAGVPLWGTLIALNDGVKPLLGIIDQPYTGERFIGAPYEGQKNTGLIRAGQKQVCKVRPCKDLSSAILTCTTPDMFCATELGAFNAADKIARLTRYSMDCYGYGLLALGCLDLVIESGLAPYDVQALIPVVKGAGGIITDWRGGDPSSGGQVIAAGDARVHEQCLNILKPAASS